MRSGGRDGTNPLVTLLLGGARSGKSRLAEAMLADATAPLFIATATAGDDEMADRIRRHRRDRGHRWRVREEPLLLADALAAEPGPVLVDCLTLWLTNLMLGGHEVAPAFDALEAALVARNATTVLVANEVGLGIVPADALSRRFRDEAGLLNQRVARRAGTVLFVAAGLPLRLR